MGKGKPRKGTQYCERGFEWGHPGMLKPATRICKHCNFTAKRYLKHCPNCQSRDCMENFGDIPRPPRKNASKTVWKKFKERFGNYSHKCR